MEDCIKHQFHQFKPQALKLMFYWPLRRKMEDRIKHQFLLIEALKPEADVLLAYEVNEEEENGGPYKAFIPLIQATNPEADILLAYEVNGEEENGGPYKASIPLIQAPNPEADVLLAYEVNGEGFFIQKDYNGLG